jgi:site-specific DNA-methyltransferase (adenine-specific)
VTYNTYSRYGAAEKDERGKSLNYRDREDVWILNRQYKPGKIKNKNELPEQLLIKMMQYSSNRGDLIADFFLGGFSTARVALGLDRRITGFELNKNAFSHHADGLKNIRPGYLLSSAKTGEGDPPQNQRKRWSEEEISRLQVRYSELYAQIPNKQKVIKILQQEFHRGYFALLNKIAEISQNNSQNISDGL